MKNTNEIKGFHFHVYFCSTDQQNIAKELVRYFPDADWHDQPIGPHTKPMFVIEVDAGHNMEEVYKFMILNRNGLSVLIHPLTSNELEDHTTSVGWLGDPVHLNLDNL